MAGRVSKTPGGYRSRAKFLTAITLLCTAAGAGCDRPATEVATKPAAPKLVPRTPSPPITETAHYAITSSATREQTEAVAAAVESLYSSYKSLLPVATASPKFQLVLYRDQQEFKRNNRSSPWAEAYYRRPRSYAYPAQGDNPHHWMLHEATHQLLVEASGYKLRRWLDEGVASYFGASRLEDGQLQLGRPDPSAYPVWRLAGVALDQRGPPAAEGTPLVRLEQIAEGSGPPIGDNVNNYYVCYWSLTHYLMHGENGKHRDALIDMLAEGGSPDAFKRLVGPYEKIEPRWHAHLKMLVQSTRG